MNVDLLKRVRDHIAEEPRRLDMREWHQSDDPIAPCGTACCIAGWTLALSIPGYKGGEFHLNGKTLRVFSDGPRLLGLEERVANALFYPDRWPEPYADEHQEAAKAHGVSDHPDDDDDNSDVEGFRLAEAEITIRLLDAVIAKGSIWWAQ